MNQRGRSSMMRQLTMAALATLLVLGMLIGPALAHDTPPSVSIAAGTSQYYSNQDVKFTASLTSSSSNHAHAVVILVRWKGFDRYWRLQPNFEFSFPCNLANRGQHTITIQTPNDNTNEATCTAENNGTACSAPYPTAYSVGSPNSATATCN